MPQSAFLIPPSPRRELRYSRRGTADRWGCRQRAALMPALLAMLLALWGCERESIDLKAFRSTEGTRLYAIELDGTVQGHMVEHRAMDASGQPAIRTVTELELPGTGRTRRSETLTFTATPPHALLARRVETRTPEGRIHVRNDRDRRSGPGGSAEAGVADDGRLADHLARPGVDPEALDRDHEAGIAPDVVGLVRAADGLPGEYRIGRSFLLRRVDALPRLPSPEAPAPLTMAVEARIGPRDAVDSLLLEIDGPAAALLKAGPGLEPAGTSGRLRSHRLVTSIRDAATERLIGATIATVRGRLRYVPGASPPDLEALLETGEGDCWEFAALFDALARGNGLESRTVTGLAWMGDSAGAFGLHAWNEVRIDEQWRGVDATFDQRLADGARIRFPDDPATQLDLQYALAESTLTVLAVNGLALPALAQSP